ncbi:major facilitator superfamily domain-containing protein 8 [Ditylenchus destructor]|uniref:Major facilitator superfamily domain-containing protein 8 n=1 Tax=Ditylenchus destructor TaxID=166010 RepID=A0AAD4RAE0_9BILA|nr:major facilitator superfamily domain-containing protein 8 [Ditylenchus destructor]
MKISGNGKRRMSDSNSKFSSFSLTKALKFPNEKGSVNKKMEPQNEWRTDWKSIYIVTLVAFIGAIHQNCVMVWPYLQLLDPTATEGFYGLLRSISSVGGVTSALAAGYISNLLQDTKWPMVFAKAMALVSCLLYMTIEVMQADRKWAFFLFELFLGISMGAANVFRTHIAMASTEADRSKAVGICSLAPAIGLLIGPMIQLCFTALKYPGVSFIFGTHINLFTAPILLTIIISSIGICLLLFCFDGRMRIRSQNIIPDDLQCTNEIEQNTCVISSKDDSLKSSVTTLDEATLPKAPKFDWIAVFVCFLTKAVLNLTLMNFITVGPPYIMMVFQWSSSEAVKYQSITMGMIALHIIFWNLAYVFFNLRKRLTERRALVISLTILFVTYLVTYPWPFLPNTIPYQNTTESTSGETSLGCPARFDWCATTTAVNMPIFIGGMIITMGAALPLSQINLDILYSKILGNIKQGTMQGLFVFSGDGLNIILPIMLSEAYMVYGPTYIWQVIMICIAACIILWIFFYPRMVSNTRRLQQNLGN